MGMFTRTPEIDAAEAHTLHSEGSLLMIDVRELGEWNSGHVPGSSLMTMATVPVRVAELPRDKRIAVICRSGARSGRVAQFLISEGLDAVNVRGGINAWQRLGLPLEA